MRWNCRVRCVLCAAVVCWVWSVSWTVAAESKSPAAVKSLEPAVNHSVVAGFERFFEAAGNAPTDLVPGGRLLLGELGCVACHQASDAVAKYVTPKKAPVLDDVGSRVRLSFIKALLTNPQRAKPGTTMPDLLASLPEYDRVYPPGYQRRKLAAKQIHLSAGGRGEGLPDR